MPGVIVLSDLEPKIDGAALAAKLAGIHPRVVQLDFGVSRLGRAVQALPAVDAVLRRFASSRFSLLGRPSVAALLGGHLRSRGHGLGASPPELTVDFRPGVRRASRWIDGAPSRLEICATPYPHRVQHASAHWTDAALAAGFELKDACPQLSFRSATLRRVRVDWSRVARGKPVIVLAPRNRGYGAARLLEVGTAVADRIGGRAFCVGRNVGGLPRVPARGSYEQAAALRFASVVIADAGSWCDVAVAAGAPVVSLHGRSCPVRHGPPPEVGTALSCSCHSPVQHGTRRSRGHRCLRCLPPSSVTNAAEELAARRWPWDWAARVGLWGGGR
ncbi:MAG: hypothetical protein R3B13_25245 [Polyangiaceae bacterium]